MPETPFTVRKHVWASGRVQGVCFREYTRRAAAAAGVQGWVRNLADGRVEAVVEGEADAVEAVIVFMREGHPYARVDRLASQDETPTGEFSIFEIR